MAAGESLAAGNAALRTGRWGDARTAFEAALAEAETGEACLGLATAAWWLGDNITSVVQCTRAYTLFRRSNDVAGAVQCAVWLAIVHKANFANFSAANGWVGRAERLLDGVEIGTLHGWTWVARAYRMADLAVAESLTERAVDVARRTGDVDLELVALAQLGLIRVGAGQADSGFALIDEALAAALAGERSNLDTVVYACCDMLSACEIASDIERAAQWCQVADEFVRTYGCPFLYAECRIYYGSILTAKGRWEDAGRELAAGLQITKAASPGLHARGVTRLAVLRTRQGRLEEAAALLSALETDVDAEAEWALSLAGLMLARGDGAAAGRQLEQRRHHLAEHRLQLACGLDLLVDARLATGDIADAAAAVEDLEDLAASVGTDRLRGLAAGARGRVSFARGELAAAAAQLETALTIWSRLELPFEVGSTRIELARSVAADRPELAVEQLRRALAALDALGATVTADRAAALLRTLGATARTGPKRIGVLTVREREVLQLLGHGLSNPEIAARLHVSRKTASHHVSNILMKLNLRNRAEAAAYVATTEIDR